MTNTSGTKCPVWAGEDITKCFREEYLEFWYPAVIAAVSFGILAFKSTSSKVRERRRLRLSEEERPLLVNSDAYGAAGTKAEDAGISIKSRHFDICKLTDTNDDGTPHGTLKDVPKDGVERLRVCVEFLLVGTEVALSLWSFAPFVRREWNIAIGVSIVKLAYWAYLFAIVTIRVINLRRVNVRLPNLWVHSTTLYFLTFAPALLNLRTVLIGNTESDKEYWYYLIDSVICIVLFFLNFTAKVGDKPSQIYLTSDGVPPSPEKISSILSFVTYSWINPLIYGSYRSSLKLDQVWGLRVDDYALPVLKSFEANKARAGFAFQLMSHFKWMLLLQMMWSILEAIIVFAPSVLLKQLLEYVDNPLNTPKSMAWTFVLLMPFFKFLDSVCSGSALFLGRRICARMKAILIGEIYAKALRRKITVSNNKDESDSDSSSDSDKKTKKGKKDDLDDDEIETERSGTAELGAIINLMSVDAFKVSEICGYLHFFLGSVIMILIAIVLLYKLLGWSALVGAVSILAMLPVNYKLARWMSEMQKKMLYVTDKRIQMLNETLQSIRIIKYFAWEDNFFKNIMEVRLKEIHQLKIRTLAWICSSFVWFITPTLVTLLSFYCYTMIDGKPLTAPIAFTALSLFTLLRAPLDQLSDMTSFLISSKVSVDRIAEFLEEEETDKYSQLCQEPGPNSPTIGFENASFSWNSKSDNDFKLKNLNISFKPEKLNVIIGLTGSGKTSLLLALLGEMDLLEGKVFLPGIIPREELVIDPRTGLTESVAYCAQGAWLLNDTIRNNILFATPYNEERYKKVIEACGLSRDLEILDAGDATEIGEKGITLSGGQKQRVSLARALYSNSRHVLLDDCLSAVDSHTALWIYQNCISGPLMANRTCILVSHNIALTIQDAEWVVVMENGRVKSQGSPEQLLHTGDLGDDDLVKSSVMNSRNQSTSNLKTLEEKNSEMKDKAKVIDAKLNAIAEGDQEEEIVKTDGKLVEEETKADGVVGLDVYLGYAKNLGGTMTWIVILFTFAASQAVYMYQSWWLRNWSLHSQLEPVFAAGKVVMANIGTIKDNGSLKGLSMYKIVSGAVPLYTAAQDSVQAFREAHGTLYYITIYAIIGLFYAFTASLRVWVTFITGIYASNRVFKRVLVTVLRARLRFFDKTPVGRLINRFSKDVESLDEELTPCAEAAFSCIVGCISTLFLITVITPGFLVFAILIMILYYVVATLYISLSRELKRYESITKSPIHQHFSESLTGVSTIRAYGVETRFMRFNLKAIDTNNRPFFYLWVANRWLALRCDIVGSMVMLFAGIFVLLSVGKLDAGLAGLSLSYAIAFSESALWIVRFYANIEMNMNSVERLQELYDIEQEPPAEDQNTEPPSSWPSQGAISVKDVSLRYAPDLPRVIKNVSFDVEPNSKIGIVGRTGAGKSTIITAFFRFLDPDSGSIHIDGVDITHIGLKTLRQAITIIPQDPTLFTGTIRSNLDPFDQYTDAQIFEALRRVNLVSLEDLNNSTLAASSGENQNKFLDLSATVTEGGNNLSQGQRQLMCLARSLLRMPKIILLDEATASIDYKSDALIQQTIREEFTNSTILTIAHRLRSIIDYDKILVMDAGKVVEYDNPHNLISDKNSLFYSMCENSGELESLIKQAKKSFDSK